ncbi:MAG: hypothetical protein ACRC78_18510 [Planktothrix sp.]
MVALHKMTCHSKLIYPDHPDFYDWLSIPPPTWGNPVWVADRFGNLRQVENAQMTEYLEGGEYDEISRNDPDLMAQLNYE